MALAKINGKLQFFNCNSIKIEPVSNGRWKVIYDRNVDSDGEVINQGREFIVVGGTKSGGARHEWFCYHPEFYGEQWVACNSMVRAIEMGVAY